MSKGEVGLRQAMALVSGAILALMFAISIVAYINDWELTAIFVTALVAALFVRTFLSSELIKLLEKK
jgi:hypothetical protein